jgi:hypothetical protein
LDDDVTIAAVLHELKKIVDGDDGGLRQVLKK